MRQGQAHILLVQPQRYTHHLYQRNPDPFNLFSNKLYLLKINFFFFYIYTYIYTCLILLPLIFTFSLCLSHSVRFFSRSWGCSSGPERQRLFSHGQYSGGGRQKSSKPTQRQTHRKWQLELCGGESYTEGRRQGGLFRPIDLGRAKELTSELKREKARRIWKRKSSKRKADLWKP